MITPIIHHYEQITQESKQQIKKLKKRHHQLGTLRLFTVIIPLVLVWFFDLPTNFLWIGAGMCVTLFLYITLRDNRILHFIDYQQARLSYAQSELAAMAYDYSAFEDGSQYVDPNHSFSFDLDLFGENSLFQSLNRTVTQLGRDLLADWLSHPLEQKNAIEQRQRATQELASKEKLRQEFIVKGNLQRGKTRKEDLSNLLQYVNCPPVLLPNPMWKLLIWIIPSVWAIYLVGIFFWNIPSVVGIILFLFSTAISNWKAKYIYKLHQNMDAVSKVLDRDAQLMQIIESNRFTSQVIQDIQRSLVNHQTPASEHITQLAVYLNRLDQRANLFAILINLVWMTDIRTIIQLEKWNQKNQAAVRSWFEALAQFDALVSLSTFAYNHPTYVMPQLVDHYFTMTGASLGHPLLNRDKCVCNDISIQDSSQFLIITGANMAGKSTYLRTISVNYLLACVGAPVFAHHLTLSPAKLVTSLRTSDSLVSNESYFFAELKRLKTIIDRLQSGEKLFIVLDEILKGTNSLDKQKGSLALVKQFVHLNTAGIIATHDLILASLKDQLPNHIECFRFEADIQKEELHFSYKMQPGVAQNLNACFLMKKMGISLED